MKKNLKEDAPTNNAGSGAIAGIGVGPQGEPPAKPSTKILKRSKVSIIKDACKNYSK